MFYNDLPYSLCKLYKIYLLPNNYVSFQFSFPTKAFFLLFIYNRCVSTATFQGSAEFHCAKPPESHCT